MTDKELLLEDRIGVIRDTLQQKQEAKSLDVSYYERINQKLKI